VRFRNCFRDCASGVFQINGQTRLRHGAIASSLREKGLVRTYDRHPVLDHRRHSRSYWVIDSETAMKTNSNPEMPLSYRDFFSGKKITVMGLGILGRGVGDVEFLASCGASLIVTDLKSADDLATSLERLQRFPNIQFVLGEHRMEDFHDRDMIIKAAGVP